MIQRIKVEKIQAKAAMRPSGYVEDYLSKGVVTNGYLHIDSKHVRELQEKYAPNETVKAVKCCGGVDPQQMPPIMTQVGNAVKAAGRVAKAVLQGRPILVSDDELARRIEICNGCEFLKGSRCTRCGCQNKYKSNLTTERCPVGKW